MTALTLESMSQLLDLKLAPVSAKVEVIEKRMAAQDERLSKVEARLNGGFQAGSQDSTYSCQSGGTQATRFVSSYVEIKNFCSFAEKRAKGITRDEAEVLLQKLTSLLPATIQPKIGELEVYGNRGHKIKVHVRPPHAVEVSLIFKEALEDVSMNYNGRVQYTTCEREPAEQKRFASAGKTRAYLEAKVKSLDEEAKVTCSWQPDWELTVIGAGGNEAVVGLVRADASLAWAAEGLRSVFGVTVEATQREFSAWRQS